MQQKGPAPLDRCKPRDAWTACMHAGQRTSNRGRPRSLWSVVLFLKPVLGKRSCSPLASHDRGLRRNRRFLSPLPSLGHALQLQLHQRLLLHRRRRLGPRPVSASRCPGKFGRRAGAGMLAGARTWPRHRGRGPGSTSCARPPPNVLTVGQPWWPRPARNHLAPRRRPALARAAVPPAQSGAASRGKTRRVPAKRTGQTPKSCMAWQVERRRQPARACACTAVPSSVSFHGP